MLIAVMLLCACRQNGTVLEIDTSKEIRYNAGIELYGILTQAQKDELAKLLVYDSQIETPDPKKIEPISDWWCEFEYYSDAGETIYVGLMSSTLSIKGQKKPYYDGFYLKKAVYIGDKYQDAKLDFYAVTEQQAQKMLQLIKTLPVHTETAQ